MKAFVDTSFYISLLRKDDSNHERAKKILLSFKDKPLILYTSHYIIDEVATVISMRVEKEVALRFLQSVQEDDFPLILCVDDFVRQEAYRIFSHARTKNISMVDCYSAALMRQEGIKTCFSFDKQFRVLGFEILSSSA